LRHALWAIALVVALGCGSARAGTIVGLIFAEQPELLDFLPSGAHFINPYPLTTPDSSYVVDGAFAGLTEQQARDLVVAEVRDDYYGEIPLASPDIELDIDFVVGPVTGDDAVNVAIGEYNFDRPGVPADHWFGLALYGGAMGMPGGDVNAAVAVDEIQTLPGPFDTTAKAVNAIAHVISHEAGHLYMLEHVMAAEGAPEWEPGDVIVTDPYDLMATGPSGLPDAGFLEDNEFRDVAGSQSGGHSSASLLAQNVGTRLIGDADRNGIVGNGDFGRVYGNFGMAGHAIFDHGDLNHDNAVGNGDFSVVLGRFGTSAAIGLVAAEPTSAADVADLIYDPLTGDVTLDPTDAVGGVITNYVLLDAEGGFLPGNFDPIFDNFTTTATVTETSETDLTTVGFAVATSIGPILPTGMDLVQLHALLDQYTYVGQLGSGQFTFDLVVIPEPLGLWLLALGVVSLARRCRAA
jgi:hypothetical protein